MYQKQGAKGFMNVSILIFNMYNIKKKIQDQILTNLSHSAVGLPLAWQTHSAKAKSHCYANLGFQQPELQQ